MPGMSEWQKIGTASDFEERTFLPSTPVRRNRLAVPIFALSATDFNLPSNAAQTFDNIEMPVAAKNR